MPRKRKLTYWDILYRDTRVEDLPWFYKDLDPDLDRALEERDITRGSFLDICTGPGTQAVQLANRGFSVTGTDIAVFAIEKAKGLSSDVKFVQDDMLNPKLGKRFDFIFDRGCFHTVPPTKRKQYVRSVKKLLRDGGLLFLKCFSTKEPGTWGPYRISKEDIVDTFSNDFDIERMREARFSRTDGPGAHAWFVEMRKRKPK
jgi:SAM-dependent methyltransferase